MLKRGDYNPIEEPKSSKHRHHRRRHHRSRHSSPTTVDNYHRQQQQQQQQQQYINNNDHHRTINTITPSLSSSTTQCSAYFIHRLDLNNYAVFTLREAVNSAVLGPKSKGLKVKLSLPSDGLVIENVHDPDQSWMYKISELLYFWPDSHYPNVVVVVTTNRSQHRIKAPYSASIFRLRGNESVQLFLRQAQLFFAHLATPSATKFSRQTSEDEQGQVAEENYRSDDDKRSTQKKKKTSSKSKKKPNIEDPHSPLESPVGTSARTEFEPEKTKLRYSGFNLYSGRTYDKTMMLNNEAKTDTETKLNTHDDENENNKPTTTNQKYSTEFVENLMRELKEIRTEIAELKSEGRRTPVYTESTNPSMTSSENTKENVDSSSSSTSFPKYQSNSDANSSQIKTNFIQIHYKMDEFSGKTSTKNNELNGISGKNKQEKEQTSRKVHSHSNSNSYTQNNREEKGFKRFTPVNGTTEGIGSLDSSEEQISNGFISQSRQVLKSADSGLGTYNASHYLEEDFSSYKMPTIIEKEVKEVLSTKISSSSSEKKKEAVNTQPILEYSNPVFEHLYENLPTIVNAEQNRTSYTNQTMTNGHSLGREDADSPYYVNISKEQKSESSEQSLSPSTAAGDGFSFSAAQKSKLNNTQLSNSDENTLSTTPASASNNSSQENAQKGLFADYLTNPLFNIDKQLLANTIANQFGVDADSPYVEQLITNQHLFVTDKRTFANMIWQMTPEEEDAFLSSPATSNNIDRIINDTDNSMAKSILKSNKLARSISKSQRITWDTTLE